MQSKLHIKKGDTVAVIAGDSKGQQGKVLKVNVEKLTAIVEGVNMISKHTKPNAKSTQGGIVKKEAPIHISNLMVVDSSGKPTRIGRRLDEKTQKIVRFSKKSDKKEAIK
jgi:large subunit ribosomal protein L24